MGEYWLLLDGPMVLCVAACVVPGTMFLVSFCFLVLGSVRFGLAGLGHAVLCCAMMCRAATLDLGSLFGPWTEPLIRAS